MRNVIFVAPYLVETTLRFAESVGRLHGVRLLGICTRKPEGIPEADVRLFHHVVQVDDCFNPDQVEAAARGLSKLHGPLHRIVAVLEHVQPCVAEVRRRLGLPGLSPEAVARFTNKAVMKDALREAGLPCARHSLLRSREDLAKFAAEVGCPMILKPPVGAGTKATYLARTEEELAAIAREIDPAPHRAVQAEEFIEGDEFSFETICINGEPKFHSLVYYRPNPLEAVRNPWIQWTWVFPREIDGPEYDEARDVGFRTVKALGMESGITHMEWFRRPGGKGIAIGEIAARPPGAHVVQVMSMGYETDMFRAWARAVIDDAFDGPWERKWALGVVFFRGLGSGRVASVTGAEEANRRVGHLIVQARLPQPGQPKSDSYEGDGYAIVRARETATVHEALDILVSTVRVHYH